MLASNLEDMAEVRRAVSVPILAHEAALTLYDSLNVIKRQAADALQLDPRFDAGFTGARIAAGMAEAAGLPVVTHTFGELGVATAAVLQLHAAHPNFILDNQTYYWNLEDDVIAGGLLPFDGPFLQVPQGPGIGVDLDRDRVAHYAAYYVREVEGRGPPAPRSVLRPRLPPASSRMRYPAGYAARRTTPGRQIEPCWCTDISCAAGEGMTRRRVGRESG